MRFATPVLALIVAALLAGCGTLVIPKPDPKGDKAFVAQLQKLCASTPALATIAPSASGAALTTPVTANHTTMTNLQNGLLKLTPMISSASPLAPTVTNLAEIWSDVIWRYTSLLNAQNNLAAATLALSKHDTSAETAAKASDEKDLADWPQLALTRIGEAQADLTKLGITSCVR